MEDCCFCESVCCGGFHSWPFYVIGNGHLSQNFRLKQSEEPQQPSLLNSVWHPPPFSTLSESCTLRCLLATWSISVVIKKAVCVLSSANYCQVCCSMQGWADTFLALNSPNLPSEVMRILLQLAGDTLEENFLL